MRMVERREDKGFGIVRCLMRGGVVWGFPLIPDNQIIYMGGMKIKDKTEMG